MFWVREQKGRGTNLAGNTLIGENQGVQMVESELNPILDCMNGDPAKNDRLLFL